MFTLYYLDSDPLLAAEALCDKHVVTRWPKYYDLLQQHLSERLKHMTFDNDFMSMYANMMVKSNDKYVDSKHMYWLNDSLANVQWLTDHLVAIANEVKIRHHELSKHVDIVPTDCIIAASQLAQITSMIAKHPKYAKGYHVHTPMHMFDIPDRYKGFDEVVDCYRHYYMVAKYDIVKEYSGAHKPTWYDDNKYKAPKNGADINNKMRRLVAMHKDKTGATDNERKVAYDKLLSMCKEANLNIEDVLTNFEHRTRHTFQYWNWHDKQLLYHLADHLFGVDFAYTNRGRGGKRTKNLSFNLTADEAFDLRKHYDYYRGQLYTQFKQMEVTLLHAFIEKNNIESKYENDNYKLKRTKQQVSKFDAALFNKLLDTMERSISPKAQLDI